MWTGSTLEVEDLELGRACAGESTLGTEGLDIAEAVVERGRLNTAIRRYFEARDFLEVETPNCVEAPGTDIYLEPVGTRSLEERGRRSLPGFLHTSPEFAMKRLLTEGFERIYQLVKVWRDGEVTDWHHPEFSMLEWYRAWEDVDAIMGDVEQIVAAATDGDAAVVERTTEGEEHRTVPCEPPFRRMTMQELVDEACGFDLLEALDYESLRARVVEHDLLGPGLDRRHPPRDESEEGRWDALFFELMIARIEPHLATLGTVFVTEWPAPLAILAQKSDEDPRVAERFELFVGGIELANGFSELTDPEEQRRRFEHDLEERAAMDKPLLPMPTAFLEGLEYGLPPSSGVALGIDRLLMLRMGASRIDQVAPFAHVPNLREA